MSFKKKSSEEAKFKLKARMQSFAYAFNGLKILFQEEHNARIHIVATILVNIVGLWYHISALEWVAVWLCIGLVFISEIINSAIENLCDHISPEKNVTIGKVKDLTAAAVLLSAIVSVVVAGIIFIGRLT